PVFSLPPLLQLTGWVEIITPLTITDFTGTPAALTGVLFLFAERPREQPWLRRSCWGPKSDRGTAAVWPVTCAPRARFRSSSTATSRRRCPSVCPPTT